MKRVMALGATLALLLAPLLVRLLKAQAPPPQTIYVTSHDTQTITGIQGSNNSIVATISTAPYVPGPIAVTPDALWAYVANVCSTTDPGSVTVADLVSKKVAAVIPVGSCPDAIVVTPDGTQVYVSNRYPDDSVSVINTATTPPTVSATIPNVLPPGNYPDALVVTPDGKYIYVSTLGVTNVYDTTPQHNFVQTTQLGGTVIAAAPGSDELWTSGGAYLSAGTRSTFNLGWCTAGQVVFTQDGRAYLVDSECGGIYDINAGTLGLLNTISPAATSNGPYNLAISPDGKHIYEVSNTSPAGNLLVVIVDTATDTSIASVTLAGLAHTQSLRGIAVTPSLASAATATTISSSVNPSVFGQQVSFTATVMPTTSSANVPTGAITFSEGNNVLGTVTPLTNGSATFTTSGLSVNSHSITVSYSGDAQFGASTSTTLTQTVGQAGTVTGIAASTNTPNVGQTVTFTAIVTVAAPGAGTPTGTVTFSANGTPVTCTGGNQTVSAGQAACQYAFSTSGVQSITASYSGDTNFTGSTAPSPISVAVSLPPSSSQVQVLVNESITVTDTESFPDILDPEAVHITDAVFVTPLIQVSAPVAEFSAGSLGFGGQSGSQTINVSDIGLASLTLTSATISGSSQFAVTQIACSNNAMSMSTVLPAGGVCAVTIGYTASATPASDNGVLTFTDNAALSNVVSAPAGSSYTQSIALNGSGTSAPPPPPPPAVVPVMDNEMIHVADAESFPDVFDPETIKVTDQVLVQAYPILVLNTTVGTNTGVTPVDTTTGLTPVTVNFSNVVKAGTTGLTTSSTGAPAPPGFQPGVPLTYFDISTTATFTGTATICIHYSGITFIQPPHLFHFENGVWVDRTTSIDPVNMIVCGAVTSFSPFALFGPLPVLTITAPSVPRQYGLANPPLNNVTYSGFVNGDTPSVLSGTLSCLSPATPASPVGRYAITCSGLTSPNYTIKFIPGVLTITPAPLTVTAASAQRVYGGANPIVTGAITGIQNGDNITATYSTTATPTSPVGVYAIVPTLVDPTGKLGNYTVTSSNGTLTVIQASTTTALNVAPNPSNFGQSVTLTATVAPVAPGAGTSTGKVVFFDGNTTLGTSTLSSTDTATLNTSSLAAGSHSLSASYGGDPNYSGSSSSAVSDQVQCGILISLSPSSVPLGGTITVTGKVISCSTTTETVVIQFTLSGPSQPNSCSSTKSVMFTTPPFPLPPKTAHTVSFPFRVPSGGVCPGTYSITAATLVNGVAVDTSTASLTITAH
jgi:YVTN family beta-propeller protein